MLDVPIVLESVDGRDDGEEEEGAGDVVARDMGVRRLWDFRVPSFSFSGSQMELKRIREEEKVAQKNQ